MSTRGLIAIEDADGKCRSTYAHFDMYVSNAGQILIDHYKTADKVEKLLALGFLSALGERLAPEPGEKSVSPIIGIAAKSCVRRPSGRMPTKC